MVWNRWKKPWDLLWFTRPSEAKPKDLLQKELREAPAECSRDVLEVFGEIKKSKAQLFGWFFLLEKPEGTIGFLMVFCWKKPYKLIALLGLVPQIAGSYRGSNFSKGGIVLANWPTSGCCSECCAGCCPGCCCGCCPGCSGSCLPWSCPAVLSRVLRITFAIGWCQGAVQRCCPGCSGSRLL